MILMWSYRPGNEPTDNGRTAGPRAMGNGHDHVRNAHGGGKANPKHHRSQREPKEKREALFNGSHLFFVVCGGENSLPIVSSARRVDIIGPTFPRAMIQKLSSDKRFVGF